MMYAHVQHQTSSVIAQMEHVVCKRWIKILDRHIFRKEHKWHNNHSFTEILRMCFKVLPWMLFSKHCTLFPCKKRKRQYHLPFHLFNFYKHFLNHQAYLRFFKKLLITVVEMRSGRGRKIYSVNWSILMIMKRACNLCSTKRFHLSITHWFSRTFHMYLNAPKWALHSYIWLSHRILAISHSMCGPFPSCIKDHKMIIRGYEELDSHDKGKWEHKFFTNYSKFFFGLTFDLLIILPAAFSLERVG